MQIDLTPLLAIVPIIIGLVAVFRKLRMPVRFAPAASVLLGVGGVVILNGFSGVGVIVGIATGLMACGLFSGTKTTVGV